jgi:hypothetical protein
MKDLPLFVFQSVSERDVDLLLLEELRSSKDFRTLLLERAKVSNPEAQSLEEAWHSISTADGESDLVLIVRSIGGERTAVLIEDKIGAGAQPSQSERYRVRGSDGVASGHWDRFLTCIVAPQLYLDTSEEAQLYDCQLSYETVGERLLDDSKLNRERAEHKALMLTAAIKQQRRGYSLQEDERVTKFWQGYWEIASREYADIEPPRPGKRGGNSRWVNFPPRGPRRDLIHKLGDGVVDLSLRGAAGFADDLRRRYARLLAQESMTVEVTGKSASFRIETGVANFKGNPEAFEAEIRAGLEAVRRLQALSPQLENPIGT